MSEKILVIDDDPDILDASAMILESRGYQVTTAQDGVEGLAKLEAEHPDLIVLDLMMPKMDGFAVYKELQAPKWSDCRDIPILILSSVREDAARRRYELETGRELAADDYIEKPFPPGLLLERIARLLRNKKEV